MRDEKGRFVKGDDPDRHTFTAAQRELGWERAQLSVNERFPDATCQHGAALSHCLLRVKHPQFFERRKAAKRARAA